MTALSVTAAALRRYRSVRWKPYRQGGIRSRDGGGTINVDGGSLVLGATKASHPSNPTPATSWSANTADTGTFTLNSGGAPLNAYLTSARWSTAPGTLTNYGTINGNNMTYVGNYGTGTLYQAAAPATRIPVAGGQRRHRTVNLTGGTLGLYSTITTGAAPAR